MCYSLKNIGGLFSNCQGIYFTQDLFSISANPFIENVSSFCYGTIFSRSTTVPEFWGWPAAIYKSCYRDISPKPDNYDNIPITYI